MSNVRVQPLSNNTLNHVSDAKFSLGDLTQKSIKELLEVSLQLDAGMFNLIPKEWQTIPNITSFCAFRLLANNLLNVKDKLTPEVLKFLDKIEENSQKILVELETKKTKAFIKSWVKELFEYAGGLERIDYPAEVFNKIAALQSTISNKAQFAYCKKNGQFCLLIHPDHIKAAQKIYGEKDFQKDSMSAPHIMFGAWLNKADSDKLFEHFKKVFGVTDKFIHGDNPADFILFNYSTVIKWLNAYKVVPVDYWRMESGHVLWADLEAVKSDASEFKILCSNEVGYRFHATFATVERSAHPILKQSGVTDVRNLLGNDELSQRLSVCFSQNNTSMHASVSQSANVLFAQEKSQPNCKISEVPDKKQNLNPAHS